MVDPKVLAAAGITSEAYKKKFDGPRADYSKGVKKLLDLASQRIRDGVNYNLANARLWYAIDQAYDSSFYQVNYTLVRGLLDKNVSEAKILSAFRSWGLTHMITDVPCAGSCGTANCNCPPKKKLDLPTFFSVFVPLVQAYTKIRWARLFNQRDIYPVFKYEPLRMTRKNRLRTEIITDRIQRQSVDMGYRAMKRQVMFQDLLYSMCLQFPIESWFKVEHGTTNGGTAVEREGIRYCTPHPSRTFCDLAHRPDTLNTDTGCEYAGYWHISRYRDVNGNAKYWNRDQMAFGGWDWNKDSSLWQSFRELYPCVMNFPISEGVGVGDLDRENKYVIYASSGSDDKSVVLTELFMRFAPSEFDLGDYKYPLWHRMTMANDITPVYVEPFAYRAVNYFGYDADGNRSMNAGMGVEIMPFQDLVGNYLTQYLLSVKSNLRNVVFFNTQAIAPEDIERIQNLGDKSFTQINMLPFEARKQFYAQVDQRQAFVSVEFPKHNTGEILGAVRAVLDVLERVLQFSAQELGQAASHEQSATETQLIAGNTDTRVSFTGGFIDDGLYAWKEQLYEGMMAYSSDEVLANVGELNDQNRAALKELGFEVEDKVEDGNEYKAGVIGKKSSLELDGIASTRDNADRVNSPAIGSALVQLIQAVTANPDMVRTLGLKQIVQWFNYAGQLLGLPSDFKLTAKFDDPMEGQVEQAEDIQKQVAELAQNVVEQNLNQFSQVLKDDIIAPIDQALKQLQANYAQIVQREEAQEEGLSQALLGIKARLDDLTKAIATIIAPAPPVANPNLPPEIIAEPPIGVPEPPVNVDQIQEPALV